MKREIGQDAVQDRSSCSAEALDAFLRRHRRLVLRELVLSHTQRSDMKSVRFTDILCSMIRRVFEIAQQPTSLLVPVDIQEQSFPSFLVVQRAISLAAGNVPELSVAFLALGSLVLQEPFSSKAAVLLPLECEHAQDLDTHAKAFRVHIHLSECALYKLLYCLLLIAGQNHFDQPLIIDHADGRHC